MLQETDAGVAGMAEQSSDCAGDMAMIQREPQGPAATIPPISPSRLGCPADSAFAVLSLQQRVICAWWHIVVVFQFTIAALFRWLRFVARLVLLVNGIAIGNVVCHPVRMKFVWISSVVCLYVCRLAWFAVMAKTILSARIAAKFRRRLFDLAVRTSLEHGPLYKLA